MEFSTVYKGIGIVGTASGTFAATINGTKVTKPSVAAIKNAIDKAHAFPEFEALYTGRWNDNKPEKIKIVGHYLKKKKWGNDDEYWVAEKGQKPHVIYTLDSEKAILEASALRKKHEKAIEALKAEQKKELKLIEDRIKVVPFPARR